MYASTAARPSTFSTAGYADGLGRRSIRFDREVGGMLECLHLRAELRAFEQPLRDRAEQLATLDDERFARVRGFERDGDGLVVVSELVAGQRLTDLLESRQIDDGRVSGIDAAFGFLLQALPALAALHASSITHGALAPGRIILTQTSQVVLLDAIYGPSLERVGLGRGVLWNTLAIVAPATDGPVRLDEASDVSQLVLSGLLLALGRPVETSGPPPPLAPLVQEVVDLAEIRAGEDFAESVRLFFGTSLPLDGRRAVVSAEGTASEVHRLAETLDAGQCLATLTELARLEPPANDPEPLVVERRSSCVDRSSSVVSRQSSGRDPLSVTAEAPALDPAPGQPMLLPAATPAVSVQPPTISGAGPAADGQRATSHHPGAAIHQHRTADDESRATNNEPRTAVVPIRLKEAPAPAIQIREARPETSPVPLRALPFVQRREAEPGSTFPWKLAAATILIMVGGVVAGRAYLHGRVDSSAVVSETRVASGPAATGTGSLAVTSEPEGAQVLLDGKDAGVTPLELRDLPAGRHSISLSTGTVTVKRTVQIEAGKQASLDVPVYSGWVAVFAPIPLEIAAHGKTLGSTESRRILLPPGRHVLTLSSREFAFSTTETVEIRPGEERVLNLNPQGRVNLNALPWAEVWVDGSRAGETPLANLPVTLGTREFVFKHPQFGERRLTTTITTSAAALSVDFTK